MSVKTDGSSLDAHDGVADLLARAFAVELRTHARLEAAITDLLTPEDGRLDDRARATIEALLARLVATVEADLRRQAGRVLVARGEPEMALALVQAQSAVLGRLIEAGLVRDEAFFRELIGRAQLELLADALPVIAPDGEEASLLARLANQSDPAVAEAAVAVLVADSRRKPGEDAAARTDLPAELYRKLVWWVAAALREAQDARAPSLIDEALVDAAQQSLASYGDKDRIEAAAMRLAAALNAPADDLPVLLADALGDRRAALFVAVLAQALELEFALARDIVLDPAGDRLWLLLRALGLPRPAIARIGLALSEADPRRDLERFADTLDTIVAIAPEQARAAIAPWRLDPSFRAALLALARRPAR